MTWTDRRNALAQAQQAAAQAIASKSKGDGSIAGDDRRTPVKQENGADAKADVKQALPPVRSLTRLSRLRIPFG
jgi:hypothetical protein